MSSVSAKKFPPAGPASGERPKARRVYEVDVTDGCMILRRKKGELCNISPQYFGERVVNCGTVFAVGVNNDGDLVIHWGGECYNRLGMLDDEAIYFPVERQEGFSYIACIQRVRNEPCLYIEAEPSINYNEHVVDALSRLCNVLFANCFKAIQDVILLTPFSEDDSQTTIVAPGSVPRNAFTDGTSRYPTNLRLHYNGGALAAFDTAVLYLPDVHPGGVLNQSAAVTIFEEDDTAAHYVHLLGRCSSYSGSVTVSDWVGRITLLNIDCLYPDARWLEQVYVHSHTFSDLFGDKIESVVGVPGGGGVQAIATISADHRVDRVCIRHISARQIAPLIDEQRRMKESLRAAARTVAIASR